MTFSYLTVVSFGLVCLTLFLANRTIASLVKQNTLLTDRLNIIAGHCQENADRLVTLEYQVSNVVEAETAMARTQKTAAETDSMLAEGVKALAARIRALEGEDRQKPAARGIDLDWTPGVKH